MRKCQHGKEWKSTKVWNENCGACEAMAELNQRSLNSSHEAAMETEYEHRAIDRRRFDAASAREAKTAYWTDKRQKGIANRARLVEERLKGEPDRNVWQMRMMERVDAFTPKQREAITYTYGYGLTQREAATVLGITREAYRKRLALADAKLQILSKDETRRGEWRWHEHVTPYGDGYVVKDTGEPYVEELLTTDH